MRSITSRPHLSVARVLQQTRAAAAAFGPHAPAPPAACGPAPRRGCRSTYIILKSAAPYTPAACGGCACKAATTASSAYTSAACYPRKPSVLVPAAPFSVRLRVRSHQCAHTHKASRSPRCLPGRCSSIASSIVSMIALDSMMVSSITSSNDRLAVFHVERGDR